MDKFITTHLLPEQCYQELFLQLNFSHVDCLKVLISKLLGLAIIVGAVIVKLPQIIKIFGAKSGEGVSFLSQFLELMAVTATVSYSFASKYPFSAWGEGAFLSIQTLSICFLILHYQEKTTEGSLFVISFVAGFLLLLTGLVPIHILWYFQSSNIFIVIGSKFVQTFTNFQNGSTGQLSVITVFLLLAGSLARIFTSIQETGDALIVIIYVIASSFNLIIFLQVLYYWNAPDKKKKAI